MPKNTPDELFWMKVVAADNGCWIWTACRVRGYGQFNVHRVAVMAHRYSYERMIGPIPEGLVLDHVCHNDDVTCAGGDSCEHRACVNPYHLEPVTQAVNLIRSPHTVNKYTTECPRGHEANEVNAGWSAGSRYCRPCGREKYHEAKALAGSN